MGDDRRGTVSNQLKLKLRPEELSDGLADERCTCQYTTEIEGPSYRELREGCPVHDPYFGRELM